MTARDAAMPEIITRQDTDDGATRVVMKEAWLATSFEAVLLRFHDHVAACMSSQAGCAFRCRHCATTYAPAPFVGNLSMETIVGGVAALSAMAEPSRLSYVDFSGVGDSSANWEAVEAASRTILERGMCGTIKVTSVAPSTWVKRLLRPGAWLPSRFLLSLHGATRAARRELIPNAESPDEALPTWARLAERRRSTINYVVHSGNEREEDVEALTALLTPYGGVFKALQVSDVNAVSGSPIRRGGGKERFARLVRQALPQWEVATFAPIGAADGVACGQLRALRMARQ